MTNEEYMQVSALLENFSKPSYLPFVLLAVSQVFLIVAFCLHVFAEVI